MNTPISTQTHTVSKNVSQRLLKIEGLVLHFKTRAGTVQAVDGVDFELGTNRAVVILDVHSGEVRAIAS